MAKRKRISIDTRESSLRKLSSAIIVFSLFVVFSFTASVSCRAPQTSRLLHMLCNGQPFSFFSGDVGRFARFCLEGYISLLYQRPRQR